MVRVSRWLAVAAVVLALLAVSAGSLQAQTVCYPPAPVVVAPVTTYYPPVTSYYAPVTTYYAPAPVTTYYAPAPVVTYAPPLSVTTYRYGLLPRRSVTISSYGPPPVVYGPRVARYYSPVFYYP